MVAMDPDSGKMPTDVAGDPTGFYARLARHLHPARRRRLCHGTRPDGGGPIGHLPAPGPSLPEDLLASGPAVPHLVAHGAPPALIPGILDESPPGGLRELLARHAAEAREVACDDPGILLDLDTPNDYSRRLASARLGNAK